MTVQQMAIAIDTGAHNRSTGERLTKLANPPIVNKPAKTHITARPSLDTKSHSIKPAEPSTTMLISG